MSLLDILCLLWVFGSERCQHKKQTSSYLAPVLQVLTYAGERLNIFPESDLEDETRSLQVRKEEFDFHIKNDTTALRLLRDVLALEAKLEINIDEFSSFPEDIMKNLKESSKITAKHQLEELLELLINNGDVVGELGRKLANHVLGRLKNKRTEMYKLLSSIEPLGYDTYLEGLEEYDDNDDNKNFLHHHNFNNYSVES